MIWREHLQIYPPEYCDVCDMELVVNNLSLPVHSQRIVCASEVLAGAACILAAKGSRKDAFSAQQPLQIPMHEENPLVAQDLVTLLYSRKLSEDLQVLVEKGRDRIQQVIKAADKYAMEELLRHCDYFLTSHAKRDPSNWPNWPPSNDVIAWAELAGTVGLPQFMSELEKQLVLRHSVLGQPASRLPIDMAMRVVEALLQKVKAHMESQRNLYRSSSSSATCDSYGWVSSCYKMIGCLRILIEQEGRLPPPARK